MTCSLRDNILQFDQPVPRYTSYPTAPQFQTIQNLDTHSSWLKALPESADLSLYIHVPFCSKLCWYCGCNTKITQRYAPVEDYMHIMLREIDMLAEQITGTATVGHIHFGGGSPGLLRARDFEILMTRIKSRFSINTNAEIAIEIDPRGVTEGRVAAYAKHGINRISLGTQDFNNTVLKSVNRQQPFSLSYDAIMLFRNYGIDAINLDLLYGLPHQTPETMTQTIEKALTLNPNRISLFGYAHVPWMKKHMRLIDETTLPDKALRFDLFETGAAMLKDNGYHMVGIDHFAKTDDDLLLALDNKTLHRNFQGYTTDKSDALIGIGASSISKFKTGYVQNCIDRGRYEKAVIGGYLPSQKFCSFNDNDHIRSHVIEQIMCYLHVDLQDTIQKFELPDNYFSSAIEALKKYIDQGFVRIDHHSAITVNPNARAITRLVAAIFDEYLNLAPSTPRHATAI